MDFIAMEVADTLVWKQDGDEAAEWKTMQEKSFWSALIEVVLTRPRWRSRSFCKRGVAPGGRLIWPEPPHSGDQINLDNRFWGWGVVA